MEGLHLGEIWLRPYNIRARSVIVIDGRGQYPQNGRFVKGFSWMPTFRWNEAMLHDGKRSGDFYDLPLGPNNGRRNPVVGIMLALP